MEQDLEITTNGQYKNIQLKPKFNAATQAHEGGITAGNHIVINKNTFAEGMEKTGQYGNFYICQVEYKGEDVGFLLNEKEHDLYKECGGVGDSVQIGLEPASFTNPKNGMVTNYNKLNFTLVE